MTHEFSVIPRQALERDNWERVSYIFRVPNPRTCYSLSNLSRMRSFQCVATRRNKECELFTRGSNRALTVPI